MNKWKVHEKLDIKREIKRARDCIFGAFAFSVHIEHAANTNTREPSAQCRGPSSNNKSYQNTSERVRANAESYQKSTPAVGNFACFSRRCFPFLSELYLWPVPPLYHFFSFTSRKSIARIIKLAADVMTRYRRAGSESHRRRGEGDAILSKNATCTRKNIRTRLIKSFLI